MFQYFKLREENQEAYYNMGRAFHQIGMFLLLDFVLTIAESLSRFAKCLGRYCAEILKLFFGRTVTFIKIIQIANFFSSVLYFCFTK